MYILSIAVPTKDRFHYLKYLIEAFVNIESDKIELVISDNSESNEECSNYIQKLANENIKYYHQLTKMSQADNCDYSISKCHGKYVTLIGDDDCISTKIIDVVELMQHKKIQSAFFTKIIYRWPDVEISQENKKYIKTNKAHLRIPKMDGKITYLNAYNEFLKCAQEGFYRLGKMPRVYHGIVEKEVLDVVHSKVGTYFPGPSPDMASSVVLSFEIKSCVLIDYPYIFSGQGFKSAAGMGLRGEHKGNLKDISFLPQNIESFWDNKVPKVWTGETIYIISAISSLIMLNKKEQIDKVNFKNHYVRFLENHPEYRTLVFNILKFYGYSMTYIILKSFFLRGRKFLSKIKWSLFKMFNYYKDQNYYNVPNSIAAISIVDSLIKKVKED